MCEHTLCQQHHVIKQPINICFKLILHGAEHRAHRWSLSTLTLVSQIKYILFKGLKIYSKQFPSSFRKQQQ